MGFFVESVGTTSSWVMISIPHNSCPYGPYKNTHVLTRSLGGPYKYTYVLHTGASRVFRSVQLFSYRPKVPWRIMRAKPAFDLLCFAAFVAEVGTTEQEFLAEAKGATGMHEMYLQIFLAHAEYDVFIELMIEKARSRQS